VPKFIKVDQRFTKLLKKIKVAVFQDSVVAATDASQKIWPTWSFKQLSPYLRRTQLMINQMINTMTKLADCAAFLIVKW